MRKKIEPIVGHQVKDYMSKKAVHVTRDTSIEDTVDLMLKTRHKILPVVDDRGILLGKIRESDIMKMFIPYKRLTATKVFGATLDLGYFAEKAGDLMRKYRAVVHEDAKVEKVAAMMVKHELVAIPVVDNSHRLIGIISASDILRKVTGAK